MRIKNNGEGLNMKQKFRNKGKGLVATIALGLALLGSGYSSLLKDKASVPNIQNQLKINKQVGGLSAKQYQSLSEIDYHNGEKIVRFVNHNNSTLNLHSWHRNKIIYQNLDKLNRTSGSNTAFLDRRNIAKQAKRTRQQVKPTGWHYPYRDGVQIYNRGHLIAYSLSGGIDKYGKYKPNNEGDQNNPRNLFTQSAYTNQKVQTIYEGEVRNALVAGQKVIYQATPIFRGNELMARGINLQAKSTDGMLNFNVYIFNVQPHYQFDYQSGAVRKS